MPKQHVERLSELSDARASEMMAFGRQVVRILMEAFQVEAFNWTLQEGHAAGQTVPHLHMHLIPRVDGDFPEPGDWYPMLRKSESQIIDSDQRPKLMPDQTETIVEKIKEAAHGLHLADKRSYDAFISYSHGADRRLAHALERQLERFAKPWYRLRAANVFRDETSLSASPELWSEITKRLSDSSYLILLASSASAKSKWVQREICYWLSGGARRVPESLQKSEIHRERAERILIVMTEGEIQWGDDGADFNWEETTALPRSVLAGVFASEPLWIDLRWAREEKQVKLDHSNERFMHAVAQLSSPIRDLDVEELVGADFKEAAADDEAVPISGRGLGGWLSDGHGARISRVDHEGGGGPSSNGLDDRARIPAD